jgi:hypothetical protein
VKAALPIIAIITLAVPGYGSDAEREKQDIRAAVDRFLRAFENLDMPNFIGCFADDATVFFPVPEPPSRFDGKRAIQAHFEQVFDAIRQTSGSSKPPFHQIVPENLQIQLLNDCGAVVTFQMNSTVRVARRTIVLQKRGDPGSAEVYDPASGIWMHTKNLSPSRLYHRATLLPDGNVLVSGGQTFRFGALARSQLYKTAP